MKQTLCVGEVDGLKTVHEVSELAGISVRTLQYYDKIGLLKPATYTDAGYRLYARDDLAQLQQILLFRELEFPLKEIKEMIESPHFDRERALDQQIRLLELKCEHLMELIAFAESLRENSSGAMQTARKRQETKEVATMSFEAFDTSKLDEYKAQAKASWGDTPAWSEFEEKSEGRTSADEISLGEGLMGLFVPFGAMAAAGDDPASPAAQQQAAAIQGFITKHFYRCTNEIFAQLGKAYGAGGDFTRNIDKVAGEGAAVFAAQAIACYCEKGE